MSNPVRHASTLPVVVTPDDSELRRGVLGPRNLEKAVRSLHEDGLVVVANVVPHGDLDKLNTKMVQDAKTLQARGKEMPFNYNVGNIQQDPPPTKSYFSPSIFLNPIASQITTGMLGPKPKWTFCSGNTALPPVDGTEPQRQPVHADADFAHPETRLLIEADGRSVHDRSTAFESDREREADLTAAGWQTLRFTRIQVRTRPETVLRVIQETVRIRSRA